MNTQPQAPALALESIVSELIAKGQECSALNGDTIAFAGPVPAHIIRHMEQSAKDQGLTFTGIMQYYGRSSAFELCAVFAKL